MFDIETVNDELEEYVKGNSTAARYWIDWHIDWLIVWLNMFNIEAVNDELEEYVMGNSKLQFVNWLIDKLIDW